MKYSRFTMHRAGLSRLDVAVLLVLLLVLIGLGIPFMVFQRQNSDRVRCAHNLRLLGDAIHEMDKQVKYLPPARIADDYATWAVLIIPYLHKDSPAAETWDVKKRYSEQPPAVREAWLREMFCPARTRPGRLSVEGDGEPNLPGAVGDYACVSGDGRKEFPWTGPLANGPMILAEVLEEKNGRVEKWRSRTSLSENCLKRGFSVTLLLGEKHVQLETWGQAGQGDGCIYNGHHPAGSARVGGPGFGLALDPSAPMHNNFGGPHADVCLFLQVDNGFRAITTKIGASVLGQLMLRE